MRFAILMGALIAGGCLGEYHPGTPATDTSVDAGGIGVVGGGGTGGTGNNGGGVAGNNGGGTGNVATFDFATPIVVAHDLGVAHAPDLASGTTGGAACMALDQCCQQLDAQTAAMCDAALAKASNGVCQAILTQLEDDGDCP
jgi:hypothetical protein